MKENENGLGSCFGRRLAVLFLVLFSVFPFQHRHRGAGKHFFKKIYSTGLSFPDGFSKTLCIEYFDVVVLTIVFTLLFKFRTTWRTLLWDGPAKFLSLFVCVSLLSIMASEWGGHLFQYVWWGKFLLSVLLCYVLRCCFTQEHVPQLLHAMAWVFFGTAVVASGIGIGQYFCQAELGLKWLGESGISLFAFPNPSQSRWLFDALFSISSGVPYLLRSCATFYHPNAFGGFLCFSLLCAFYLYFRETERWKLIVLQLGIFLFCFALFTTFSRSGILGLTFATTIFLGTQCRKNLKKTLRLLSLLAITAVTLCTLFYAQICARGGILNYNTQVKNADQERIVYQKIAVQMEQEHPWLGVGFNNFQFHAAKYAPNTHGALLYKVHNIFLLVLAETGRVGLACFLLFLGAVGLQLFQAPKTLEIYFLLSVFLGLLLIGGCDMYLLENTKLRIVFFTLLGLICIPKASILHYKAA